MLSMTSMTTSFATGYTAFVQPTPDSYIFCNDVYIPLLLSL